MPSVAQDPEIRVSPYLMMQSWLVYSHGQEHFDATTNAYELQDPQWGMMIRRGRMGMKASLGDRWRANVMLAFDQVGNTPSLAPNGGTARPDLTMSLFDAQLRYRVLEGKEWLFVTTGFFRPQMGRESMTSAWNVGSLEKALSQTYLRKHLVNAGPGRAPGLNLGGLWQPVASLGLEYNAGIFMPAAYSTDPAAVPTSPLGVGRVAVNIGQPEHERYSLSYQTNYFHRRKGFTVALAGAWQGASPVFRNSSAVGVDVLANSGPWNLDAEWILMQRTSPGGNLAVRFTHQTQAGHVRLGYLVGLREGQWLELTGMVMHARGPMDETQAASVQSFGGRETTLDGGLNLYLHEKHLTLTLHYVWHTGNATGLPAGTTINDYFSQSGIGAIRRGNYAGFGVNVVLGEG